MYVYVYNMMVCIHIYIQWVHRYHWEVAVLPNDDSDGSSDGCNAGIYTGLRLWCCIPADIRDLISPIQCPGALLELLHIPVWCSVGLPFLLHCNLPCTLHLLVALV